MKPLSGVLAQELRHLGRGPFSGSADLVRPGASRNLDCRPNFDVVREVALAFGKDGHERCARERREPEGPLGHGKWLPPEAHLEAALLASGPVELNRHNPAAAQVRENW